MRVMDSMGACWRRLVTLAELAGRGAGTTPMAGRAASPGDFSPA